MLLITAPALLSDCVEALIKEARAHTKMLREDAEREARATDVVAVRPFGMLKIVASVGAEL